MIVTKMWNNYIHRTLFAAVLCAVACIMPANVHAQAQSDVAPDTIVAPTDTLAPADSLALAAEAVTMPDTLPAWYVEPVIPEHKRAPRRAKAAASCMTDSVQTYDVDSVLVEVASYDYDNAGRVIRSTKYACNPDGSRIGTFKEEYGFDATGTQVMTAVYEWVSATGSWTGKEKTEFAYDGELMISSIEYAWVSEAWVADKKNTWKYDDQERVIEYYEFARDKNTNQLVYSKGFAKEWDAEDRLVLDIEYKAYSNGGWSAGTKKETKYDANGNKIEYTYYSSITNSIWGGDKSTRELWAFDDSNAKTKYEKYTWSNGNWVGSSKEEWGYTDGKQTMYAKYKWQSNAWVGVSKEVKVYTANNLTLSETYTWGNGDWIGVTQEKWTYTSGKKTLYEKNTWSNGAWVGVEKEEWEYASGKDKRHEKFSWADGAWQTTEREDWTYNSKNKETLYEKKTLENGSLVTVAKRISEYDGSNQILLENYSRTNGALVGTTKETWVYTSGKKTQHNKYTWGDSDWADSEEEVWAYEGSNETNYEQYAWENGVKTGKTKRTTEYTSGKKTQLIDYAWANNAWVNSDKEVWAYTSGKQTLHETYTWANNAWAYTEKEVWAYDGSNQTLHEKYTAENGALVGVEKEEWEYTSGKITLHAAYAWFSGDWVVSAREGYDLADNQTLVETYTITSTSYKGSKKEEYTFNAAGKVTNKYVYKWNTTDKEWRYNTWTVTGYDDAGNKTENCKYTWSNDAWKGSGTRELRTYNSDKKEIEYITQSWSTSLKDWLNVSRTTATYTNGILMQEADFTWGEDAWVSGYQKDYYYNAVGQNYLTMTTRFDGTDWVNVSRTDNTFDADDNKILTYNASWKENKWVMTSMERMDIIKDAANHKLLQATWKCSSDSVWVGVKKDTVAYSATGKLLFEGHYNGWAGNDWVPNYIVEWKYDDADHEILNQRFDWEGNAWVGHFRYEHEYDEQGREIMKATYLNWTTNTSSWRGSTKYSYEYDANGNKTKEIIYQWGPDGWEYLFANVSVYDSSNRVVQLLSQRYKSGTWNNDRLYVKEYRGSTIIKDNSYSWVSGSWVITTRNEKYYDNDSQAKLRKEVVGTWDGTVVVSFKLDQYFYACDPHYFTIRFVDEDGTLLESDKVEEGKMPVYDGATPTKAADAQYTYTFKGWDKELVVATVHATYTATYTQTLNKYTITWLNEDNSLIDKTTVEYGVVPTHADATKAATAEYTYAFAGWDNTLVAVTGDATYKATFSSTKNSYTITWLNDDNSLIDKTTVEYGIVPTHADASKAATAEFTYTFAGWDNTPVAVTGDATYKATFSSTKNSYTITWLNDDNTLIDKTTVEYGVVPTHADASKAATPEFTYTFAGWDNTPIAVTGDATYKATFSATKNSYTITWLNDDNSLIDKTTVEYGVVPTHVDAIKAATAEFTYTFAGWDNTPVAVTGDATYKATFSATKNSYTITWLNDDNTLIDKTTVEYGIVPTHADASKAATAEYTYTFAGWDNTPVAVTGDATYKATFSSTKNKYTITWLNDDNTLIDKTTVEYGIVPTHVDATKAATAEYTYTFAGWDNTPVAVTGDATYKATFSATKNKYTITWLNDDNTQIDQTIVEYGIVPEHADATKASTAEYTYTFAGWDNTPIAVTGDATYKATFSATKNKYTITWLNDDNTLIDKTTVEYGVVPTHVDATKAATAEYTYTFAGWDNTPIAVTGDATYKATFSSTKNSYTITWLNDDNTLIDKTTVEYGVVPTHADATKAATAEFTYTFAGWDNTPVAVTGDATYKATFSATKNKYTITWLNDDNTLIDKTTVEYGVIPTHADASKSATAEYTYTFAGWDNTPVAVTGDATYKATFSATKNKYTITWLNDDNTLIDKTTVEYGIVPTHADATKAATAEYTYTFAGWDNTPVAVTGDATYKATFSATKNSYTITWLNDDNTQIDQTIVEYGVVPTHADATKAATAEFTYTFAGWDNTPIAVTGDATYKATFSATKNSYTITWLNEDNSLIDKTTVEYGVVPTHADASKAATAEYTYTFAGWDNTPIAVTGDATYKATFSATKNKYTITWIDGDGKTLKTEQVAYGETPAYVGETPSKAQTAQYSYEFNNTWSPAIEAVTGEATYIAQFTSIVREYTITWIDGDGNTLKTEQVAYGETPEYVGETPTKAETAQYSYEFNNTWSPAIEAVTGEATYTAQFTSIVREYTITWIDGDGNTLKSEQVAYGETPAYTGETPTKAETAQYSYEFNNTWSPAIEAVTGEATYTAQFTSIVREYTITWIDGDGNTLKTEQVAYGETPEYVGETPTKAQTAQYSYEFNNTWSPAIVAVTGEATYTAQFTSIVREYTITWIDGDGNTLKTEQVAYGETPEYVGETPTKAETAQYSYEFNNTWSPAIEAVTGDATYTAQFNSTVREYMITIIAKNWSDQQMLPYGTDLAQLVEQIIAEKGDKVVAVDSIYTLIGWSPELQIVTEDATYEALYIAEARMYTITWLDEDGTTLDEQEVEYGVMPEYAGETPTKEDDEQFTYTFSGWNPAIAVVTGDATYVATYTAEEKPDTAVGDITTEEPAVKVIENDLLYIIRGGMKYAVQGARVR